jgi:hypothetical protein
MYVVLLSAASAAISLRRQAGTTFYSMVALIMQAVAFIYSLVS